MQPRAGVAVSTRSARGTVWSWGKWCRGRRWGTWWRPPGREGRELMPGPGPGTGGGQRGSMVMTENQPSGWMSHWQVYACQNNLYHLGSFRPTTRQILRLVENEPPGLPRGSSMSTTSGGIGRYTTQVGTESLPKSREHIKF